MAPFLFLQLEAWLLRICPLSPLSTLFTMLKATYKRRATTLSKTLLTAGLLGGAALSTLGAGSAAQAAGGRFNCSFGNSTAHAACSPATEWILGDKKLTKLTFTPTIPVGGPPSGYFSFIWDDFGNPGLSVEDMWTTLVTFNPSLPPPSTGSYSYDLAIIEPYKSVGWMFKDVELDVDHAGSGQVVTKVVKDAIGSTIATLESVNGMPIGPVPLSGTSISVTDSWDLNPATGTIMAISNTYTQTVPGPLPLLGAGAAFGFSRRIRNRIKGARLA